MTLEEINSIASAIQSISIAIAVMVGGIWALYRFFSLKSIEKAAIELDKLKSELTAHAILQVDMDAEVIPTLEGTAVINISIKNLGSKDESLDISSSKVMLGSIDIDTNKEGYVCKKFEAVFHTVDAVQNFIVISPNEERIVSLLAQGLESNVYLITSHLVGSQETIKRHESIAASSGLVADSVVFGCDLYFDFDANKALKWH